MTEGSATSLKIDSLSFKASANFVSSNANLSQSAASRPRFASSPIAHFLLRLEIRSTTIRKAFVWNQEILRFSKIVLPSSVT